MNSACLFPKTLTFFTSSRLQIDLKLASQTCTSTFLQTTAALTYQPNLTPNPIFTAV